MAKKRKSDMCSGRYVISLEVSYPGDFAFAGRFWRALDDVAAMNAGEAVAKFQGSSCPRKCDSIMATDFPPAFDVLEHRRAGKLVS